MNPSSLSMLADAASGVLDTKKRVASNRICSTCAQCHKSWPTALALESHAKSAHHEAWICDVVGCGVGFKNRSAFSKHKSRHNNPDREYPCLECGHSFPRQDNLSEHRAIQGRCKPSKSHGIAQCSSDRSKRRKLHDQIRSPSASEVLNDSPTAIVTLQQPQILPSIEHGDRSWPQLSVEPVNDTSFRVTSINHLPAWQHTHMPVDDRSSTEHFEGSSLGSRTSIANGHLFHSQPDHPVFQHVGESMHTSTTNNAIICQDIDHAGGNMPNHHNILPDKASDAATVVALLSHDRMGEGQLSAIESEADFDLPPAENGVMVLQQDPPWLKWLQERREQLQSGDGGDSWDIFPPHASEIQAILELALLYCGGSPQDLQDIMSNLSIADLLQPIEQLKQAPRCCIYQKDLDRFRTALIPDLPTLYSFFGRGLAVGAGPHQALWSFAVRCGQNEMVELLLEKGAHPDQEVLGTSTLDRIPLIVACDDRNWDLVTVLLKAGANLNVFSGDEPSVLFFAVQSGNFEVVKLLLEEKADPNFNSESKLFIPLLVAIGKGCTDIVELLLQEGAEINIEGYDCNGHGAQYGSHCTPLLLAITKEHIGIVNLLIKHGVDPAGQNAYYNPFIIAAGSGCTEVVELLLEEGADLNLKGQAPDFEEGRLPCSPLIYAIHNGHDKIAKLLLEKGADPSLSCEDGYICPLLIATGRGRIDIVELLLDKGADVNITGRVPGFRVGELDRTPLTYASERDIGMVKLLLNRGADPNFNIHSENYLNPLFVAAWCRCSEIFQLLLDDGAYVNARSLHPSYTDTYTTPLCFAIKLQYEKNEIVRLLLDHGADLEFPADSEEPDSTPLCLALQWGDADTVKLLLAKNVRVEFEVERCMDWLEEEDRHSKLKLVEEARLGQDSSREAEYSRRSVQRRSNKALPHPYTGTIRPV